MRKQTLALALALALFSGWTAGAQETSSLKPEAASDEMPGTVISRPLTRKSSLTPVQYTESIPSGSITNPMPTTLPEVVSPSLGFPNNYAPTSGVVPSCAVCPAPGHCDHVGMWSKVCSWLFYRPLANAGSFPCEPIPYTPPLYTWFPCKAYPRWTHNGGESPTGPGCATSGAPCASGACLPQLGAVPKPVKPTVVVKAPPKEVQNPNRVLLSPTTPLDPAKFQQVGGYGPVYGRKGPIVAPALLKLPATAPVTSPVTPVSAPVKTSFAESR